MTAQYSTSWPYPDSFYAYDPMGKRVMKETNPDPQNLNTGSNPLFEFYIYGITGQRLVTVDCNYSWQNPLPNCWVVGENVYFGRKLLVSNGVNVVTDRLGSVRANTQGERFAYYPYGEERTSTVDGRDKFATYFRDGVGQDYADQRYYNSSMGRFWTPDPGGIKTADPRRSGELESVRVREWGPGELCGSHGYESRGEPDLLRRLPRGPIMFHRSRAVLRLGFRKPASPPDRRRAPASVAPAGVQRHAKRPYKARLLQAVWLQFRRRRPERL